MGNQKGKRFIVGNSRAKTGMYCDKCAAETRETVERRNGSARRKTHKPSR